MSSTAPAPVEEAPDYTNLIVNYLPLSVTEDSLRSIFSPYGELERVKLMKDKRTGQSASYGFVKFKNEDDAKRAIEGLNGAPLEDKKLHVDYSRPHTDVSIYVGNFLDTVTEEELRKRFETYGTILDCKILYDLSTGKSRGCGFVRFEKRSSGTDAIGGLKDAVLAGFCEKPLTVRVAQPHSKQQPQQQDQRRRPQQHSSRKEQQEPCRALFVYGLPATVREDSVTEIFRAFGPIEKTYVHHAEDSEKKRSYAIVTFTRLEDAVRAQKGLDNVQIAGPGTEVQVSFKSGGAK